MCGCGVLSLFPLNFFHNLFVDKKILKICPNIKGNG